MLKPGRHSLLPYIGGKSYLYPAIHLLTPEGIDKHVEIFGGSGIVTTHQEHKKGVEYVLNDRDPFIANIYTVFKDPELYQEFVAKVWEFSEGFNAETGESFYKEKEDELKARYNEMHYTKYSHDVARAVFAFFIQRNCWQGEQGAGFAGSHRVGTWFNAIKPENLAFFHQQLEGVTIENEDFSVIIENHATPKTFFYADPPYSAIVRSAGIQSPTADSFTRDMKLSDYPFEFNDGTHMRLLTDLMTHYWEGTKYMISNYDNEDYRNNLTSCNRMTIHTRGSAGKHEGEGSKPVKYEALWWNYNIPYDKIEKVYRRYRVVDYHYPPQPAF